MSLSLFFSRNLSFSLSVEVETLSHCVQFSLLLFIITDSCSSAWEPMSSECLVLSFVFLFYEETVSPSP